MGDNESGPFQSTFKGFLKVAFQGSRATSDIGLIRSANWTNASGLRRSSTSA
jgi:hypothetical protein